MNIIYVLFLLAIVRCQSADTFWDSEEAQTITKEIQDQLDLEWEQMEELMIDYSDTSEEITQDQELEIGLVRDQEVDLTQDTQQEEYVQNQESILPTDTISQPIQQESVNIEAIISTNQIEQQVGDKAAQLEELLEIDTIFQTEVNEEVEDLILDQIQQTSEPSITEDQKIEQNQQAQEQEIIQAEIIDQTTKTQTHLNDNLSEIETEQLDLNIQSNDSNLQSKDYEVEQIIQDQAFEQEYNQYTVQDSYETDPNQYYRDKLEAESIESQVIRDGIIEQRNNSEIPIQDQIFSLLSSKLTEIEDEYLDGYALIHYGGGCYIIFLILHLIQKILCYQSTSHPFRHQVIREFQSSNNNEDTIQLKVLIENLEKTIQNQNTKIDKIQFQYSQLEQGYLELQRTLKNLLESKVRRQLSQVNDSKESH